MINDVVQWLFVGALIVYAWASNKDIRDLMRSTKSLGKIVEQRRKDLLAHVVSDQPHYSSEGAPKALKDQSEVDGDNETKTDV